MYLKAIELSGFKSFAKKTTLEFTTPIAGVVGPNGSGKSNIAEAFRFVLGEQSMKAMRGKKGEDLIWNGTDSVGRANRASVTIVFNNASRLLDIDFDEVRIERTVFRDGVNEYRINESVVRLKDIAELLAKAHIGASGHHMISQGEADRILRASPAERRSMVEDALGLRVFEYKKRESERKLEKTLEHVKEAESIRRELLPHAKYLQRQAERLQRAQELQTELGAQYAQYIVNEQARLASEEELLAQKKQAPTDELAALEAQLVAAKKGAALDDETGGYDEQFRTIEQKLQTAEQEKSEAERTLGRIEGQLFVTEKKAPEPDVPAALVRTWIKALEAVHDAVSLDTMRAAIRSVLTQARERLSNGGAHDTTAEKELLQTEKARIEEVISTLGSTIQTLHDARATVTKEFDTVRKEARDAEREVFTLMTSINQVRGQLRDIERSERELRFAHEAYDRVKSEAESYMPEVLPPEDVPLPSAGTQAAQLRSIERLHARLEEAGGVDTDVLDEYEKITARIEFLEREIADLQHSRVQLEQVIVDLESELTERFRSGISTITTEFNTFFGILFNGGSAKLLRVTPERKKTIIDEGTGETIQVIDEEAEVREGVDITVSIPRKKVQTLDVLSGGERALVSIALIFAMSQVNPPPFVILDETDAALDEANSKRYADMVTTLANKSQLILITHNRATMSAAGELYGITMGRDGVSTVLSVQLEEAVKVAK